MLYLERFSFYKFIQSILYLHIMIQGYQISSIYSYSKKSMASRLLQTYENDREFNISLENFKNQGYDTQIFVGALNAAFYIQFDTSTSWSWLPGIKNENLNFPNRYNCLQSETCTILNEELTILTYPQGNIQGFMASDLISFPIGYVLNQNSLTLNLSFMEAENIDPVFNQICVGDGIFGLGLSNENSTKTIIDLLYDQGIITSKWFSLYLSNDKEYYDDYSRLIFQGYDPIFIQPNKTFIYENVAVSSSWSISIQNYSIGSLNNTFIPVNNGTIGILASTSTYIGVNPDDMNVIWKTITNIYNNTCNYNNTIGYFCFCEEGNIKSFPNITIRSTKATIEIPASQYVMHNSSGFYSNYIPNNNTKFKIQQDNSVSPLLLIDGDLCVLLLHATNETFNYSANYKGHWILGTPILELYYTIYNKDNMSIGFVPSLQYNFEQDDIAKFWLIVILIVFALCILIGLVFLIFKKHKKNKGFKRALLQLEKEKYFSKLADLKRVKPSGDFFLYDNTRKLDPLLAEPKSAM